MALGEHEHLKEELRSALLSWSSPHGRLLHDQVARLRVSRWPRSLDALRWLHASSDSQGFESALRRVEHGTLELAPELAHCTDTTSRLQRAAIIARAAYAAAPVSPATGLEEELLFSTFAEHRLPFDVAAEPTALTGSAHRIELPVLLVDDDHKDAVVVHLRVWAVPAGRHVSDRLCLVRAPSSFLLQLDASFRQSLANLRSLLQQRAELAETDVAIAWDLAPFEGAARLQPLLAIGGGSLGAALALAALYVLRKHLSDGLRDLLEYIEWPRVAVSAQLCEDGYSLGEVKGLHDKFKAWQDYVNAPSAVFVPSAQPKIGNVELHRAGNILDLIARVAEVAGELTPSQARLLRRMQVLKDDERLDTADDRALLAQVAHRDNPVKSVRGYLLHRYAHCAYAQGRVFAGRDAKSDLRFVRLILAAEESASGFNVPRQPSRFNTLKQMMASVRGVDVWQIRAEPGAGKSTLLRHFEMTLAHEALANWVEWSQPPVGEQPGRELCIAILAASITASAGCAEQLRQNWRTAYPHPHFHALDEILARYRVRFVVDGLNEIGADTPSEREDKVRGLIDWLDKLGNIAPPVFAVRTLEATHLLTGDTRLQVRRDASLERWRFPEEIGQYCAGWTENGAGQRLMAALETDARLREMCSLPLNLAAQCELLADGLLTEPARDRAQLFTALLWMRLQRELRSLARAGQLNRRELVKLNELKGRAGLPGRQDLLEVLLPLGLIRGLTAQAHRLTQKGSTVLPVAEMDAPPPATAAAREAWLEAVAALGIVEWLPGREPGLRFQHQSLWQEFFAALALVQLQPQEWPPELATPALPPIDEARRRGDRLIHGISPWEEPVKQAAQIDADPARWIEHLIICNPGLAGRAAAGCLKSLPGELFDHLRRVLLDRSMDPQVDLRLRVEAGDALGEVGDPRYINGRADKTPGKRCLVLDDAHWIAIPAGRYTVGSEEGEEDEKPPTELQLDSYEIAWAAVTNAEYRCFVEDKGYENQAWWPGEAAQRWLSGDNRMDERAAWWARSLAMLRQASSNADFEGVRALCFLYESQAKFDREIRPLAHWTEEEAEAWIEREFGATLHRLPAFWNDSAYNAAAQPLVGVSLYESRAYARWLAANIGGRWQYRLPSEAEWQVAAQRATRGKSRGRSASSAAEAFNHEATGLRRSTPAGVFPAGSKADGPSDMLGNVWERTVSKYTAGGLNRDELMRLDDEFDKNVRRAVRGGSWDLSAALCRVRSRNKLQPGDRFGNVGFRLVRCPSLVP